MSNQNRDKKNRPKQEEPITDSNKNHKENDDHDDNTTLGLPNLDLKKFMGCGG